MERTGHKMTEDTRRHVLPGVCVYYTILKSQPFIRVPDVSRAQPKFFFVACSGTRTFIPAVPVELGSLIVLILCEGKYCHYVLENVDLFSIPVSSPAESNCSRGGEP